MRQYYQKNKTFFILLFVILLVHLIFFFNFHELWWDSGVYAAMGKYIFSLGSAGFWEHIRPPLLPVILGFFWVFNLNMVLFGRIIEFLFSMGAVFLLYEIAKHYFNERCALFASVIFAFSSIFFYMSFHLYTEIPAVFFVLLAVYLFIRKKYYWSGASVGLAFLFKFPAGLFLIVLLIALLINKELRNTIKLSAGFVIPVLPVLILYQVFHGNALLPFIDARDAIQKVVGCNILRFKPWWQYFVWIISENSFNLFSVIGLIVYFKKFKKSVVLPLLCLVGPLIYFSQLHCRDYRYLVLFIPFVAMFSGLGISYFVESFQKRKNLIFAGLLFLILGFSVFKCISFYSGNEVVVSNPSAERYFTFLEGQKISGEVWSSNPVISFYTDARIEKMYYPVYDAGVSTTFHDYLINYSDQIQYVFLDNCGGGMICAETDPVCISEYTETVAFLESNFTKVFDEKHGNCFYQVYEN